MEWPQSFYELRRGEGCPTCAQGRPDETPHGARGLVDEDVFRRDVEALRG